MNKKISVGVAVGLMAITAAVTFIITSNFSLKMFNDKVKSVSEKQEQYSKLSELDTYIRSNYVGDIDEKKLVEGMVSGYIGGLGDEYARYLTAEENARLLEEESGVWVGLGFGYEKSTGGYIRITSIISGSSAEQTGLQTGDIITAVNNTDVIAYEGGYDEAVSLFNCDEGQKLRLYVKRTNEDGTTDFINYEVIAEKSEKITVTARIVSGNIGYIRIAEFNDKTEAQLKAALDSLADSGAESMIFDVRNNDGGSMTSLTASLNHILGAGEYVSAYYKDGTSAPIVVCTDGEKLDVPMTVLVNQNTSGSAELFAFALRDAASAKCVGRQTAGKGYLLDSYKCSDGSVIKLSAAVLQTKSSGNFNGIGLKPDFDVQLSADIDFSQLSDTAAMIADTQLIKAVEVAGVN